MAALAQELGLPLVQPERALDAHDALARLAGGERLLRRRNPPDHRRLAVEVEQRPDPRA
ncbi:MAG: hypothetical protein RL190_419, partial [Actinomycetota bacterium]